MKTLMYSYKEHRHAQPLCKILLQFFNFFCSLSAALWLEVRKILICHDLFCSLWEIWELAVRSCHLSSLLHDEWPRCRLYLRHGTSLGVKHLCRRAGVMHGPRTWRECGHVWHLKYIIGWYSLCFPLFKSKVSHPLLHPACHCKECHGWQVLDSLGEGNVFLLQEFLVSESQGSGGCKGSCRPSVWMEHVPPLPHWTTGIDSWLVIGEGEKVLIMLKAFLVSLFFPALPCFYPTSIPQLSVHPIVGLPTTWHLHTPLSHA